MRRRKAGSFDASDGEMGGLVHELMEERIGVVEGRLDHE